MVVAALPLLLAVAVPAAVAVAVAVAAAVTVAVVVVPPPLLLRYTSCSFTSKHLLLPIAAKHASEEQTVSGRDEGRSRVRASSRSLCEHCGGRGVTGLCMFRRSRFRRWSAGAMKVETE